MPIRINGSQQSDALTRSSNPSQKGEFAFDRIMSDTRKLQEKDLQAFLVKLDKKGKDLSESFSLRDLADFKELVGSFMRSTFGQSRSMSEESFWDLNGRPKVLSRIKEVNKALEELGQKVIDTHAKPLDILNQVGEIRGLIIDLFG